MNHKSGGDEYQHVVCGCLTTNHVLQIQPVRREGIPWGFTTSIMRDGVTLTDISVSFDEEVTLKYDWVGKRSDGFPQLEGNAEEIRGKHFVIRSVCAYICASYLTQLFLLDDALQMRTFAGKLTITL